MSDSKPKTGWLHKASPASFSHSDAHLHKTLGVKDMLALGVGTIVSTAIFTLPGIVAADHAGPAVAISFVIAAIVSGLAAFAYAEFASALPFAGLLVGHCSLSTLLPWRLSPLVGQLTLSCS